ncbi:MAG: LysR family transcriptional regulator [Magnetovibrionaceae bacterium]
MDRLEAMRAFATVVEQGSFTAAAKRLGTSTKMVSKWVAKLEESLNAQLLLRTTRSVSLTELGTAYLERCRSLLDQMDELDELVHLRRSALAGPIRMTAPTGFGSTHLTRALVPFLQANPEVKLELNLTEKRVALVEEGYDLAVRIGSLTDSTLIARKLAPMPLIICASPAYLDRFGHPGHPKALSRHECLIGNYVLEPWTWRFSQDGAEVAVKVAGNYSVNGPAAVARLAEGGLGIGRCPLYSVADALREGRLVALFPDFDLQETGVFAVYPPNRHLTARVRALIDHLSEAFGMENAPWVAKS